MSFAKCKWVKRRESVLQLLVADPDCFGLGRAVGRSHVATDELLFCGALARAGWHCAGPGAAWGSPVGVNEGHGLEETFWASEADIPRGSMFWLHIMWLQRHKESS